MRQEGEFDQADRLRKEIMEAGFEVEDTFEGPRFISR